MKPIITSILYLILLLCLSVFVFDPTHLYYEIWWLDIPMHILGGLGVASLTVAIASYKKYTISLLQVLLVYLSVAVVWELYELVHEIYSHLAWGGWSDTVSDVLNGGIGATCAYFFLKK